MHSEFYNVELDRIRYSLVWEDSNTLYRGLEVHPHDQVLVITSAGCNVLNTLLKAPASVTAIDLNPVQNKLLLFKKHLILQYDYAAFRALLGLDGPESVAEAWRQIEATLPEDMRRYWSSFFLCHPNGLMAAGKLETYLNGFYHTLDSSLQEKLKQLIDFEEVEAQYLFFLKELHHTPFQEQFTFYFDEANLSKGRDPKLFKYAAESGGTTFYKRLQTQIASQLVKNNFFFRFFFFGPTGIPPEILPPCYQEQSFKLLQGQLHKLKVVNAEAIDYLLSEEGRQVNKASLSNIFEYTSHAEFNQVYQRLFAAQDRDLRMIFWNLLQEQGAGTAADNWLNAPLSAALSKTDACFYFRNVRVQANVFSEASTSLS
ncbi:DUF3419 family protein [Pontibacter diazotrophicus]|uniref:DUF3419 family protein n=1 Tax=Pontibacter diazotrophicus TaxID=1400979 RepID=A0A3D8LCA1_9BACT|nr:DUF3419 family protein [Pontibacter diazotrophicus]RDV14582.1 DUF3419 family protein [Pontibacter diazotrophicus]